jgi:hypothetical protein
MKKKLKIFYYLPYPVISFMFFSFFNDELLMSK